MHAASICVNIFVGSCSRWFAARSSVLTRELSALTRRREYESRSLSQLSIARIVAVSSLGPVSPCSASL